ncbi:MAG: hypothetical protein AAB908_02720 [Patescibacteria group bacterium]
MDPLNTSPIASGSQMPPPAPEPQKSSIGPVAGAVIVILLLIAGGLYFWGAQLNNQEAAQLPYIPSNDTSLQNDATVMSDTSAGLPQQSSSDDVSSIEADANAMNVDQLNAENSAELDTI